MSLIASNESPENVWLSDGTTAPLHARLSLLWDVRQLATYIRWVACCVSSARDRHLQ
ncbi:hypothetical protein M404DRAFT_999646 [Pisolithus tinctorius Marx 270]|uniref:Uncharacterized protein n=1 Tax=Pisolithus tinctorius Marx 270 TaxID=870435 RepID=A0A0C3PCZ8_PISTI|nr:hypothetical protein M404DRAFT_999646 [Pisolithus tinctorius Marx 270]